jgi:hypothetical protein
VRVLRGPTSPAHEQEILDRIDRALLRGVDYLAVNQNCQHFTNWCYAGIASSQTIQAGSAIILGLATAFFARESNRRIARRDPRRTGERPGSYDCLGRLKMT